MDPSFKSLGSNGIEPIIPKNDLVASFKLAHASKLADAYTSYNSHNKLAN
jgi:hypothetical protein